jgi:uncharacterized damage-inducible protein DinB
MTSDLDRLFVGHSVQKLEQMTNHIETCLARLTEEQIWQRGSAPENSVGNLVLHLCGNLGQWIGHYIGGRPDTRDRPKEFAVDSRLGKTELKDKLRKAVEAAKSDIASLDASALARPITTTDSQTTALNLVYQVVGHFQEHTGQIMFATKLMTQGGLGFYVTPSRV